MRPNSQRTGVGGELFDSTALHERVDSGEPETRKGIRFERSVHVSADKLGISGVLDLVEKDIKTGKLRPVEYKRGKPKPSSMDEIQLCAQALCLEEMIGQNIEEGALWYMQTRHRISVVFSDNLRSQMLATIIAVRKLLDSSQKPLYLIMTNTVKPVLWWRFASRSC